MTTVRGTGRGLRRYSRVCRRALRGGLILFCLIQLALFLSMETWLPEVRDPEWGIRSARLKRTLAEEPQRPLTVLLLGSSRTAFGIRAGDLETALQAEAGARARVFNLGMMGGGPIISLLQFRRSLEQFSMDAVVIEIMPNFFAADGDIELNRLPADRLSWRELKLIREYGGPYQHMKGDWLRAALLPVYGHRFKILARWLPEFLPVSVRMDCAFQIDDRGDIPGLPMRPDTRHRAVEGDRLKFGSVLAQFRMNEASVRALRDLLALCRLHGIRPAILYMPEASSYRGWYREGLWSEFENMSNTLSRDFQATVYDARAWMPDEYFTDAHHLSGDGARLFTARLAREALFPLVCSTHPPTAGQKPPGLAHAR